MNPEQDRQLDSEGLPKPPEVSNSNSDDSNEPSTQLGPPVEGGFNQFGSNQQSPEVTGSAFGSNSEAVGTEAPVSGPSIDKMIAENNQGFIATNQFTETAKKPKKKKLIIGSIVGILLALIIGAGSVFALVYNKAENVVGDSMLKMMMADSGSLDAVASVKTEDGQTNINFKSDINNQQQSQTSLVGDIAFGESKINLDLGFITDGTSDFYVRADGLVDMYIQFVSSLFGANGTDAAAENSDDPFIKKLDELSGKWIKFTTDDLGPDAKEEADKSLECLQDKQKQFQADRSAQKEITDLLKKHKLFNIETVGVETVNDRMSNHYRISPVDNIDEVSRQLMLDMINTKAFKMVDDCSDEDMAKELRDDLNSDKEEGAAIKEDDDAKYETTVDYWVDIVNHEPVKLKVATSYEESTAEVVVNIKLNSNPAIEIPKDTMTFEEVQAELQQIMMESYSEEELVSPNTPVLGMSLFN